MVPYRKRKTPPPPVDSPDCPLRASLRFLGGTWTPSILWYLRDGPRRFSELKGDLGRVSAKVLTARLRRLETDGLVRREDRLTSPPTVEYSLTEAGQQLRPALEMLLEAVGRLAEAPAQSAAQQLPGRG